MFLNGNFVALPAFQRKYGVVSGDGHAIPTRWQSALFQSGQCGAFVGVFLAGPVTNRLGYRWTTIMGLILMNATIFVSFFVSSRSPAPCCRACPLTQLPIRPTRSPSLWSDKRWKGSLGDFSSRTHPRMPARLFLSCFEAPARLPCK